MQLTTACESMAIKYFVDWFRWADFFWDFLLLIGLLQFYWSPPRISLCVSPSLSACRSSTALNCMKLKSNYPMAGIIRLPIIINDLKNNRSQDIKIVLWLNNEFNAKHCLY